MRYSLEGDYVDLARSIIALCSKIPFNLERITRAAMNKAIKKAMKYASKEHDVSDLNKDIQAIMDSWRQKTAGTSSSPKDEKSNSSYSTEDVPPLVREMDGRLFAKRGPNIPKIVETLPEPVIISRESSINSIDNVDSSSKLNKLRGKSDEMLDPSAALKRRPIVDSNFTPQPMTKKPKVQALGAVGVKVDSSLSSSSLAVAKKIPVGSEKASRESYSLSLDVQTDIGVKELDVPDIVPFSKNTSSSKLKPSIPATDTKRIDDTEPNSNLPKCEPPPRGTRPGPGGLKKSAKRAGLVLQFRDSLPCGKLSDVIFFEVDKIGKETKAYKATKELAKQEKMFEKSNLEKKKMEMEEYNKIPWER